MDHLTKDNIQTIERLHSAWIDLEVAGEAQGLLAYCAENIELRPPDGPSVYGRDAVLTHLEEGTAQIHSIEISDRHLCGSSERVSLTAKLMTSSRERLSHRPACFRNSQLWLPAACLASRPPARDNVVL